MDSPDYARLIAIAKSHAETGQYQDWAAVRHRMQFDGHPGTSDLFERLMIQTDIDALCKKAANR